MSLSIFPWSSRISLVPFRTFRGPLFPKPVTGQELFFCRFLQQTGSNLVVLLLSTILDYKISICSVIGHRAYVRIVIQLQRFTALKSNVHVQIKQFIKAFEVKIRFISKCLDLTNFGINSMITYFMQKQRHTYRLVTI